MILPISSILYGIQKSESYNLEGEGNWSVEFSESFSNISTGEEPENMFILDGEFLVQRNEGNKVLELAGSPVGDFGFLFGSRIKDKAMELQFSFHSTRQGRRYPAIAAGIGGMRGYRFRWNASARKILLFRDEVLLVEKIISWESSTWWQIRFQVLPHLEGKNLIRLKLWQKGNQEPQDWFIEHEDQFSFKGGKCVLWGFPYAGNAIHFDDLNILSFLKY
ncbi:MAG: hypothetical protein P8P49_11360 [Opitutales bacterium]|nr:hypothetical protein [Opitutales bacterium]